MRPAASGGQKCHWRTLIIGITGFNGTHADPLRWSIDLLQWTHSVLNCAVFAAFREQRAVNSMAQRPTTHDTCWRWVNPRPNHLNIKADSKLSRGQSEHRRYEENEVWWADGEYQVGPQLLAWYTYDYQLMNSCIRTGDWTKDVSIVPPLRLSYFLVSRMQWSYYNIFCGL